MSAGDSWKFDLVIGSGNLTLYDPHIAPMWSFVPEGGGIYMNYGYTGVVKIIFGITESNRINNRYRNIVFKYNHWNGWRWEG